MKERVIYSRLTGEAIARTCISDDQGLSETELLEHLKSLGLQEHISEPAKTFEQGNSFRLAASHLRTCSVQKHGGASITLVPAITLSCFAIELFLKALALEYGKSLTGHDVFKIFESLPEPALERLKALDPEARLPVGLQAIGDSFVNWRYVHEYQTKVMDLRILEFVEELTFHAASESVYRSQEIQNHDQF